MARKTVPAGWQSARLVDMGGGLVTAISPDLLNDNEAQVAEYVDFSQKGTIKPCLGRRNRYSSPFSTYPVMGMHAYYKKDGTSRLVIKAGDKIFYDKPHWVKVYDSETDWNEGTVANVSTAITPGDIVLANPAEPTFSRNSVAYLSDGTQVASGVPRFEPGKFAQALMVEEGTTNLVTNPFFGGTYSNGLAPNWSLFGTPTVYENTNPAYITYGSKSQRVVASAGDQGILQGFTVSNGVSYTAKVRVYIVSGQVRLDCRFGATFSSIISPVGYTGWWEANVGRVSDGTYGAVYVYSYGGAAEFYVDAAQYEAKAYPTSFIDATRSPETLTIPTAGVLDPQEGTVECRVYFPPGGRWSVAGQSPTIFWAGSNSTGVVSNQIYADVVSQGLLRLVIYDSSGNYKLIQTTSVIISGWHYLAYKWDSTGPLGIFVNGVKQTTTTSGTGTGVCSTVERFTLGFCGYDNARHINTLIDDLRISSRARTDAEIAAAYQSGVPLEWDEWTTYLHPFDGNLNFPAAKEGYWKSQVLDVSLVSDKASGQIAYEHDVPANTSVRYKSRSSSDQVTWSDWVEISPGGGLNHPANNYVQVMAVLSTTAYPATPAIHKITVSFDAVPQATELLSGLSASGEMFAETFNDLCIIVDGVDPPKKWDGVNAVTNLGGSPPAARYVAAHQNRLWLYGTVNNPSRLYFSELLDPENWPVLNFIDVSPDDGDRGTGLKPMTDVLVVAKQHAVYLLVGDSIENFALRPRFPDKGCLSPRAVSVASNRLSLIDDRGVSLTDLTEVAVVTGRIEPSWKALNPRRLDQVLIVEDSSMLYIVGPGSVSIRNDTAFVLDLIRNCWGSRPNFNASCAVLFREGGHQVLLFGDSTTGQVFSVDSTTELGNVVPMKWESKAFSFGSPERLKALRRIFLQVKPGSINGQVKVSLRVDLGALSPPATLDVPAGSGLLTLMILAGALGVSTFHTVSVRVEAVTPGCLFEVHSIAFEYLPLGVMAEE